MKLKKILILVALISILAITNQSLALNKVRIYEPLNESQLNETIILGHEWLLNAQDTDGHFNYEYIPFLNRFTDDDNMVRQAGVLYILGEIAIRDEVVNERTRDAMINAIKFYKNNSRSGNYQGYTFKCLNYTSKDNCQIGGTSLALIGLLDFVKAYPGYKIEYADLIDDYKDFILAMNLQVSGFRNIYYFNRSQDSSESPFSNGEGLLALVRYYKYNPDPEIKELIDQNFEYNYNNKDRDAGFYLWGMTAIKDLYKSEKKPEYIEFVKDFTDEAISKKSSLNRSNKNLCAYIEGVVSAYSVLEENISEEEKAIYLDEIDYWLVRNKRMQLEPGDRMLMRFQDQRPYALKPKSVNAYGGFLTALDEPVQRIDFTQHCVSAYLQKFVDIDASTLNTLN
ncbi:hypothetical protein GF354_05960 [Candidatus Peregrinibacteria bacterium]|nr:hypothetical protein [Candidatus Peregrinibacteria bacterium]